MKFPKVIKDDYILFKRNLHKISGIYRDISQQHDIEIIMHS